MRTFRRIGRRLLEIVLTLLGVAILVFLTLRVVPGNQITASMGTEAGNLTPGQMAALRAYYGIDQPIEGQFLGWIGSLLQGNLGIDQDTKQSVLDMTLSSLPVTLELAILATILGLAIGIPLALISASRPNGARDAAAQTVGLAALAIPSFLLGSLLLAYVSRIFHYNPNALGFVRLQEDPALNLQQMLFPALVLGFGLAAPIMRTARTSLLEVQSQDFVRTAHGKGVSPGRIRVRHVLRAALIPIVTMTGIQFGYLLGGAVVVEQIFSLPGMGRQVLLGLQQKEYAVVQSTVLIIALLFLLVNLFTDQVYRLVDPRVRST
ncbi:MAG: ABC transporter permease [Chloroflexota bacterium]